MSRKPIRVVAREAADAEPLNLAAWLDLYIAILAQTEGLLPDPKKREAA